MHRILLIASFTALALVPASGRAQGSGDETGRRLQATRAELEARRDALREMARTARPDWLVAESTVVQLRLDQGDFRVGDRVVVTVEDPSPVRGAADRAGVKSEEQQLSDTFTVGAGQELLLPVVGTVSLKGAQQHDGALGHEPVGSRSPGHLAQRVATRLELGARGLETATGLVAGPLCPAARGHEGERRERGEIGRASCRERG